MSVYRKASIRKGGEHHYKQLKSNGEDCAICLEPLEQEHCLRLECGHVFHRRCILMYTRFIKVGATFECPICKRKIKKVFVSSVRKLDSYNPPRDPDVPRPVRKIIL